MVYIDRYFVFTYSLYYKYLTKGGLLNKEKVKKYQVFLKTELNGYRKNNKDKNV